MFRTLLDKYKRSHFGAFYPCPKQSAFHSYQVAWFVTNLTRPQQQTIFLPQNSGERFLDCTKTICSQGRQSVNYKCNSKKRSLGHKSFTFKYWWRNENWRGESGGGVGMAGSRKGVEKMRKIYLPQEILDSVDFLKMRYKSMPVNAKTRKKLKTKMHISNGKSLNLL